MEEQELWYFLFGRGSKKVTHGFNKLFLNVIFYPCILQKFQVSILVINSIKLSVLLVAQRFEFMQLDNLGDGG